MINERKLTPQELEKRKEIIKNMLSNKRALVAKYGSKAEEILFGRATNATKKDTADGMEKLDELIKSALRRPISENVNEGNIEKTGLYIFFNSDSDYDHAVRHFGNSDLYFEEQENLPHNDSIGYIFFPEEVENYDELEKLIQIIMDENDINGSIEGEFNENLKEVNIKEDYIDKLKSTGNLTPPIGGGSLAGKNYVYRGDTEHDVLIFSYNPDSSRPFGIVNIAGYGLSSKIMSRLGMKEDSSNVAGVDEYYSNGNYEPIWVGEKTFSSLVQHFDGGLSREANSQRDFYKGRHDIDENFYSRDIEVQADEEEAYQNLKRQINVDDDLIKRIKKQIRKNLPKTSSPKYSNPKNPKDLDNT